ncbi:MAG: DUF4838 domain-containing protein [Lentisphaeria bacterium]
MKKILYMMVVMTAIFVYADAYKIVLPPDALAVEKNAAEELQKGLLNVTGEKFEITAQDNVPGIYIGQSATISKMLSGLDFSTLKEDEVLLKHQGQNIILSGARPRGVLYAIYEYLERYCGVRYWTPVAEYYPVLKGSLPLPDYQYAPIFYDRKTNYEMANYPRFAVKMRINHDFYMPRKYPAISEEWGGHRTLLGWVHTFRELVSSAKYGKTHPEYFALRDGVRSGTVFDDQLCLTNPELRKELVKNALLRLKKHPGTKVISISQNDSQTYCMCDECNAFVKAHGNQTDLLVDTVNYVAEELNKVYPDLKVETIAYNYTTQPPKTVVPKDNVIIRLCTIHCDFSKPLSSKANKLFSDELLGWSKISDVIYIWNYVTNFTQYYRPNPNLYNIAEDLRYFAKHKVRGIMEQGCGLISQADRPSGFADLSNLRAYLISKLMWNPNLDTQQIIDEFVHGYYGKAAPFILKYIQIINAAGAEFPYKIGCYSRATDGWLSDQKLLECYQLMLDAQNVVAGNKELTRRVELAALSIKMTLLEREKLMMNPPKSVTLPNWKDLLEEQIAMAQKAGVPRFREHRDKDPFAQVRRRITLKYSTGLNAVNPPDFIGKKKWYGLLAKDAGLFQLGHFSFVEKDPNASLKTAVRMLSTRPSWWIQYNQPPSGFFDVYVQLRCDAGNLTGYAATIGAIDRDSLVHHSKKVSVKKIAGKKYVTVKIGTFQVNASHTLYVAPIVNKNVKAVWVDRFILVEKEK